MDVLVVGSGGREYSIGYALSRDEGVDEVYFAPGNGATGRIGTNVPIKDYRELALFAKERGVDLTIVGPEAPLVDGIVDIFKENGLTIFGPSAKASQIEGSKVFMKSFLSRHNIPTAKYIETDSLSVASKFIDTLSTPIVIKADGLCGGKGVIIAQSHEDAKSVAEEMLSGERFGDAGSKIVVEEFLDGYELSVFAICDGKDYVILPASQDHKRVFDGDKGPNTGGMGAYAPTPLINDQLYEKLERDILKPTLDGMKSEGMSFTGVLFMGIMVVDGEPFVLEYNVRFGDPECEVLMPLLKSSPYELFYKASIGKIAEAKVEFIDKFSVGVVMASKNYPFSSSSPSEIVIDEIHHKEIAENTLISYAGVSEVDGKLYATGGRVLVCVGVGESIKEARDRAYMLVGQVHFAGKRCRMDIAYQALGE